MQQYCANFSSTLVGIAPKKCVVAQRPKCVWQGCASKLTSLAAADVVDDGDIESLNFGTGLVELDLSREELTNSEFQKHEKEKKKKHEMSTITRKNKDSRLKSRKDNIIKNRWFRMKNKDENCCDEVKGEMGQGGTKLRGMMSKGE